MTKNKTNYTSLIITSFVLIMAFALPAKAEDVCCVTRLKNNDYCDGSVNFQLAKKCSELPRSSNCIISIEETSIDKCLGPGTPKEESKPITITPQVSIPGSDFTAGKGVEIPASARILANYIIAIFKYLIGIMGIIAAVVLMFAGIRWLTASGNQAIIGEAKKYIFSSLTGLALTLCSFLLLSLVNTNLVNLTIPDVKYIANVDLGESLSAEDLKKGLKYNGPESVPDPDPFPKKSTMLEHNILTSRIYKNNNLIKNLFFAYPALAVSSPAIDVDPFYQCAPSVKFKDYSKQCECDEPGKTTYNDTCTPPKENNLSTICSSGCGLVSTYMILNAYGLAGPFVQEINSMAKYMEDNGFRVCHSGTKEDGLVSYVKKKGLNAKYLGTNLKNATPYLKKSYPVLAGITTASGGGHYIVLHWQEGDTIHIKDPIATDSPGYTRTPGTMRPITKLYLFYSGNLPDVEDCSHAGESCDSNNDCCNNHKCYWTTSKWACSENTYIENYNYGCSWNKNECRNGFKCLFNGTACTFNKKNIEKQSCHQCNNSCIGTWDWGCHKDSDCCSGKCYTGNYNTHQCHD